MNLPNLDNINKEDVLSVSIALLYVLKGFPQFSIISELPYIIDYENFIRLIQYYGGKTLRIPTIEEVNDIFKILLLYQYYDIEENSWDTALKLAGFSSSDSLSAKAHLQTLRKLLKEQEIGGRTYE